MSNKFLTLALLGSIAGAACERQEEVRVQDPIGEPAPLPGPTLAPPIPSDTPPPIPPDTLPPIPPDSLPPGPPPDVP